MIKIYYLILPGTENHFLTNLNLNKENADNNFICFRWHLSPQTHSKLLSRI